ncbi:choice-of-anchor P family protein [Actinokineospora pegani]|uniref:choice-of-anchor P family protein n=1 Tax=Actinokineospora pegani TaxID=2654637 RepID=UPI0012E9D59F|nr:choice-of-anchor P family protein [Actinokineospora pegani]
MKIRTVRRGGVLGVAVVVALIASALPASAAPGDGSAYAADVNVTLLNQPAVDIGPLAPSNTSGPTTNTLASITVPGVLNAGVVTSAASLNESTGVVHSEATIADLRLVLGNLGSIGSLQATCDATQAGNVGTTSLTGVNLLGVSIPGNPAPNTTVSIPPVLSLASLTFNEQIANPDGSLTVNAVHLRLNALLGVGDVIIGSATCGPAAAPIPLASGLGLWIGLGLVVAVVIPVGLRLVRRRTAAV